MLFHRLALVLGIFAIMAHLAFAQQGARLEQAKPWLGVAIDKGPQGVLVTSVLGGTPAEASGIQTGDQILVVGKTVVKDPKDLIAAVQAQGVGNTVTVKWLRAGKDMQQEIKLVSRPDQLEVLRAQLVGKPAPAFDLKLVHGSGPAKSADLKGKVTIVEFWATWCPACRATHQRLSELVQKHKGKITVLAISDEDVPTLKAYVKEVQPKFSILADPEHATSGPWMVQAIPQLAVIDQSGKVVFATVGAGSYLEEAITAAEGLLK